MYQMSDARAGHSKLLSSGREYAPYPTYKDSSIEWMGEIPTHWAVKRLKRVCKLNYGDSLSEKDRLDGGFMVFGSNGPIGVHRHPNTGSPCIIVGRKGSSGKIHYSSDPVFAIDTTFYVDNTTCSANVRWLYYVLLNAKLDDQSKDSAVPGLGRDDAYNYKLAVCSSSEQRAIVKFIDHETAKIDTLVEKQERLINLLQERRAALISHAVTKGLNPNVPMKDSGIEWMGEIPAHWKVKRLKRVFRVVGGATPKSGVEEYWDGEIVWVTPEDLGRVTEKVIRKSNRCITTKGLQNCGTTLIPKGSLVLSTRAPIGHLAIAGFELCINQGCHGLVSRSGLPQIYSFYYFCAAQEELESLGQGSTFSELPKEKLKALPIAEPPAPEQRIIAAHLDHETAKIDSLIAKIQQAIKLQKELRSALISVAVTGKIDVRQASVSTA